MSIRKLSWHDVEHQCVKITEQVLNTISPSCSTRVDSIIGLSRGGLVPATMMAHRLGVREILVHGYHSYDDCTNTRDQINDHGVMYQDVVCDLTESFKNSQSYYDHKQILIVDDLCDEGLTLQGLVKRLYNKFDKNDVCFYTATLYCKEHSVFTPDFVGEHCSNEWLAFPWEVT